VPLLVEAGGLGLIVLFTRLGVRSFGIYTLVGLLMWFAFQESGLHATIAGVLLGLLTPARPHLNRSAFAGLVERATGVMLGEGWAHASNRSASVRAFRRITRETVSPLEYLESMLHPWVGFAIMPIFALANAGVPLQIASFGDPTALAVGAGLVIGKPVGIALFSWIAVRAGFARLPEGVGWPALIGGGALAGIGFTMALFVAGLALEGPALEAAKVGILGASALAAAIGMAVLARVLPVPSGAAP
jgi:NhaA family Na+:H+ antiporter